MENKTENEFRNKLAFALKEKRISIGISQQELADNCNLSRKTICSIESGKFWICTKQLVSILGKLGMNIAIFDKKTSEYTYL